MDRVITSDSDALARLGKKQVLKRRFGFWSLFAFAVCELITWETVLALLSQGYDNGGPAGLVYGFIIAWSSTLCVAQCAEAWCGAQAAKSKTPPCHQDDSAPRSEDRCPQLAAALVSGDLRAAGVASSPVLLSVVSDVGSQFGCIWVF